jgi:hypothetical protein
MGLISVRYFCHFIRVKRVTPDTSTPFQKVLVFISSETSVFRDFTRGTRAQITLLFQLPRQWCFDGLLFPLSDALQYEEKQTTQIPCLIDKNNASLKKRQSL